MTGHYGCGGVTAAIENDNISGYLADWLRTIRRVQIKNLEELKPLDSKQRINRMCELNVLEQTSNYSGL